MLGTKIALSPPHRLRVDAEDADKHAILDEYIESMAGVPFVDIEAVGDFGWRNTSLDVIGRSVIDRLANSVDGGPGS